MSKWCEKLGHKLEPLKPTSYSFLIDEDDHGVKVIPPEKYGYYRQCCRTKCRKIIKANHIPGAGKMVDESKAEKRNG
jgi:hypothetical protein